MDMEAGDGFIHTHTYTHTHTHTHTHIHTHTHTMARKKSICRKDLQEEPWQADTATGLARS